LAANGRLNETILIFTSDNGFLLGQHRIMYKGWPYEESIRVPLSIRVPGVGQQTTLLMALNNDLAPTILDYAQAIATIPMDGLSLKPAIMDPQLPNWRTRFLSEFFNNGGNINAESFWDVPGSAQGFTIPQPAYNSVRALSEVYVEYANGEREYYDLVTDPFQMENDPNSPAIGKLQAWINLLKTCGNGSCQTLEKLP
jgi:arylsulfatase A-like enzyme